MNALRIQLVKFLLQAEKTKDRDLKDALYVLLQTFSDIKIKNSEDAVNILNNIDESEIEDVKLMVNIAEQYIQRQKEVGLD